MIITYMNYSLLLSIFQGAKIIQSFLWYLNPRQVFDLSQGGPQEGSVSAYGMIHNRPSQTFFSALPL